MLPTRERLPRARRAVAFASAAALVGVGLTVLPANATVDPDTGVVTIDLVGINDFHGRISTQDSNGAVALASAVEDVRADNPDTVFVSAGDNFGASTFVSMINDDVPTTEALDVMGLAVSALGNHEFDQGRDALDARIAGTYTSERAEGPNPAIEFPYLGANVYEKGTQTPAYTPSTTVSVPAEGNPVTIGFVGLLTPTMESLVSPDGIATLDFGDMAEAAEREVAALAARGDVDVIVILVHDGSPTPDLAGVTNSSTDFGALINSLAGNEHVDAVFSGHTHVEYLVEVDRTGAAAANAPLPVVQTGALSDALAQITIEYDPATGEVQGTASSLIDLEDYPEHDSDLVSDVAAIVTAAEAHAAEIGAQVVGTVEGPLYRARQSNGDENRGGESTIGNLIADAQLWALESQFGEGAADISLMNPGGIRADIVPNDNGEVTYAQVATAQPFGNTLVTLELTGAQVIQVLEEQWQPDTASRPFLKLGVNEGLFYLYDPEADRGERITQVYLDNEPLDEDATYTVLTNSFLAAGGDDFSTFAAGTNKADRGVIDLQAFVDYFEAHEPVLVPTEQRAIGAHWISDQQTPFAAGDSIELDLSSLIYSAGESAPEVLSLELYDPETDQVIDLGTVDVDASIVDTTDEVGRAQIRVTVPAIEGLGEDPQIWQLLAHDEVNEYTLWFDVALVGEADVTPPPDDEDDDDLADTGVGVDMAAVGGLLLLTMGGLTVVAVRRRNVMTS